MGGQPGVPDAAGTLALDPQGTMNPNTDDRANLLDEYARYFGPGPGNPATSPARVPVTPASMQS
jgi:hypothetical protein